MYEIRLKQVLKAQISCIRKTQMPMARVLITLPFPSQPESVASWGVSYDKLADKEKFQAWFKDGSVQYAGAIQKWMVATL